MDRVMQALADQTRRDILDLLRAEALSAGDIAEHFPSISRPAVSQHLTVLREADLVTTEKKGRHRIYRLNPIPLEDLWKNWLSRYETVWQERLETLKQVVETSVRNDKDTKGDRKRR